MDRRGGEEWGLGGCEQQPFAQFEEGKGNGRGPMIIGGVITQREQGGEWETINGKEMEKDILCWPACLGV